MKKLMIVALAASIATPALAVTEIQSTSFIADREVECELDGIAQQIDFGALGRRGQAGAQNDNGISLFCNQPFSASLRSNNGYLKLVTTVNPLNGTTEATPNFQSLANPGFAAGLDYTATIAQFNATGNTSQIAANTPTTLAPLVPAQNVNGVSIRYDTIPGTLPLLGGGYNDTLTITLTTLGV